MNRPRAGFLTVGVLTLVMGFSLPRGSAAAEGISGLRETKLGRLPDSLANLVFEKHGWSVAAVIRDDKGAARIWVNGQAGPEYDDIIRNGPSYHPDGTLEFLAHRGGDLYRLVAPPR